MSVEKMMVGTPGHVPAVIAKKLDCKVKGGTPEGDDLAVIVYPHGEYGWLIVVPTETDHQEFHMLPACLAQLMWHARRHECSWLLLDRDAGPIANFPTFDW